MKNNLKQLKRILCLFILFMTPSCEQFNSNKTSSSNKTDQTHSSKKPEVKNLIFMIGDGMGLQQISFARSYLKYAPNNKTGKKSLNIERMANEGDMGLVYVEPHNALVVDSASSATQYATGFPAISEVIGLDEKGQAVQTILEKAKAKGLSTGLVSDTRITHATPASFGAHVAHRSMANEIAEHLIHTGADLLYSGGLRSFLPQTVND